MTTTTWKESAEIVRAEDVDLEEAKQLRPQTLDDFLGQEPLKAKLRVAVEAAKLRGESLGHMLFAGPAGLGKTSLAGVMANELGVEMTQATGHNLTKTGDLAALIVQLEDRDILFVDEVHALPKPVQETLYTAMEDYRLDIKVGGGPTAKVIPVELPRFTLIGATTRTGDLTKPMLDRFAFDARLELYSPEELEKIVVRAASTMDLGITQGAAQEIGRRGRGTPRIAIKYLRTMRDYACVLGYGSEIDDELAEVALDMEDVDSIGLTDVERRYLTILIERFQGGPVGVINLAATLGEEENSVKQIENYLIQAGMIAKINRGRIVRESALRHLGYPVPKDFEEAA